VSAPGRKRTFRTFAAGAYARIRSIAPRFANLLSKSCCQAEPTSTRVDAGLIRDGMWLPFAGPSTSTMKTEPLRFARTGGPAIEEVWEPLPLGFASIRQGFEHLDHTSLEAAILIRVLKKEPCRKVCAGTVIFGVDCHGFIADEPAQ
jgi:hypothetical protein